jgi:hypothetical protein
MLALLVIACFAIRRTALALARREEPEPRHEEEIAPLVMSLGLFRDGVMSIRPPETSPCWRTPLIPPKAKPLPW